MPRKQVGLRDGGVRIAFACEAPRPEYAERLRKLGKRHYLIDTQDEGDPWLRLDVDLANTGKRAVDVTVDLDPKRYMPTEMFLRLPRSRSWRPITCRPADGMARIQLRLRPGVTGLAVAPRYGYADLKRYLKKVGAKRGVTVGRLCQSGEGRTVPLVTVTGRPGPAPRENVLVVCRPHAYESAGSLVAEGMIDFLLSGDPPADFFLDDFDFHFVPMHNVDGVTAGLDRFTRVGGPDLNRDMDCNRAIRPPGATEDPELVSHMALIDDLRPAAYLNLHNWTGKFRDGLLGYDLEELDIFEGFMPACVDHQKHWHKAVTVVPGRRSPGRYARETCGTLAYVLEFPWYLRDFAAMRDVGRRSLIALIHSLYQKRALNP